MSSHNPVRDFFCLRWASPLINLQLLALGWLFIILKAPTPTGQPARLEENLATFKNSHSISSMAQFSTRCSLYQNPPFDGKDKLAGRTSTKGNNRRTYAFAATLVFTPAVAPVIAPLATFGSPTPPWLDTQGMSFSGSSRPF